MSPRTYPLDTEEQESEPSIPVAESQRKVINSARMQAYFFMSSLLLEVIKDDYADVVGGFMVVL